MKQIHGSINTPKGFKAAGEFAGLKKSKKDLAIIYSMSPCMYAGAFTTNIVKAAPVVWDWGILCTGIPVQAIVVNSGNANAATGQKGKVDTEIMAEVTAECLEIKPEEVLVCSTGVIGVPLPIEKICDGIGLVTKKLSSDLISGQNVEQAILTTDTFTKSIVFTQVIGEKEITLAAIGKGSGMIHPNMATMLAFVTTDVSISQEMLQKALNKCVDTTFNMITVDGDTSTNDSVIVLANGEAANEKIVREGSDFETFCQVLYEALKFISICIVKDGEGATKFIEVQIEGANSFEAGKSLGKSILTSSLVKTAFFGEDANWGRILAAMGNSGVPFDIHHVNLSLKNKMGTLTLLTEGMPILFDETKAKKILEEREIIIHVTMGEGNTSITAWGCDLSYDYVKINGEYRT